MGFLDKAKQMGEQAKTAAAQAADRANDAVEDVQTKRELQKAYGEFGETAFKLAEDEAAEAGDEPAPTEAVEQPLSGAGPGAA